MVATFLLAALCGAALAFFATLTLLVLGLFVAKRHPAAYDPARKAKRFTAPAFVLVWLIALGVAVFALGLVMAGIAALAPLT